MISVGDGLQALDFNMIYFAMLFIKVMALFILLYKYEYMKKVWKLFCREINYREVSDILDGFFCWSLVITMTIAVFSCWFCTLLDLRTIDLLIWLFFIEFKRVN